MTKYRPAYNVNTGEYVLVNAAQINADSVKMQLAQMQGGEWALVTVSK